MQIENLTQPPLETSLMGVVRGVFDHYGIQASTPWLYGATGHAFVANVHTALCPSGPYCWNGEGWERLLRNLGVERKDLGFFGLASTPEQRAEVEAVVRAALDEGVLCSQINMDHQLISGYDDEGFTAVRPWGECPVTPGRLTFGSWAEFGEEIHVSFHRFDCTGTVDDRTAARESLEFAVDLYENPGHHTEEPYGMGPDAFVNWIAAVRDGHGQAHGAWWNATVYAECRKMAGAYIAEIGEKFPQVADTARSLALQYASLGEKLLRAADKKLPADEKVAILEAAAKAERAAVGDLPAVIAGL